MLVDHWFELHGLTFHQQNRYESMALGPYTETQLVNKLEAIVAARKDNRGRVVAEAQVLRVDLTNGVEYRTTNDRWKKFKSVAGIAPMRRQVVRNQIYGFSTSRRPVKAWLVLDRRQPGNNLQPVLLSRRNREGLLSGYLPAAPCARLLVFEATFTLERHIVVDQVLLSKALKPARQLGSRQPRAGDIPVMDGKPVVGFRTWIMQTPTRVINGQIIDGEPQLFGLNVDPEIAATMEWADIEVNATCFLHRHRAPAAHCSCGFYARHEFGSTGSECRWPLEEPRSAYVRGAVLGSGDVLIHDEGWRAESARIIGFERGVRRGYLPDLQKLAAKFDVPILERRQLEKLALKKGRVLRKSDLGGV